MKGYKAKLGEAEKVKKKLIGEGLIDFGYKPLKTEEHIIFPLARSAEMKNTVDVEFEKQKEKIKDLREALKGVLSREELEALKTSYDTIGSIAILEIDDELRHKEKLIAEKLLEVNNSLLTVLRKDDKHKGPFRNQKYKYLAGEKTTVSVHKENGCLIKLDVSLMYYSPRLGNDRIRIAENVKKGERILVIGCGCGPYPIVISKHSHAESVVGVDINKEAIAYAEINKKLNKLRNVLFYVEDGSKFLKKSDGFDRIVLATPENSDEFIELAFEKVIKGHIHYNFFSKLKDVGETQAKLESIADSKGKKISIKFVRNGHHAPYIYRMSADIKVL